MTRITSMPTSLWASAHQISLVRGLVGLCVIVSFQATLAATYYSADFDNTDPGRKELDGGQIDNVTNPFPDATNTSAKVGRCRVNNGGKRAEYSTPRLPTDGKRYVYRWMYYLPANFATADLGWRVLSQWKTYPCEVCTNYSNEICDGCGGIFDELRVTQGNFKVSWRAKPDCRSYQTPLITGRWVSFKMDILWTNSSNGYAKLWVDGVLVSDNNNIKTLFDRFPSNGSCDIYWGVGLYGPLRSSSYVDVYIDNISITDDDSTVIVPPDPTPTPDTRPNLALNKPATSSSSDANVIANAVDGDLASRWSADVYPQWAVIDLGSVAMLDKVELVPYLNRAYTYRMEVSTNGTAYTIASDRTANTTESSLLIDSFPPMSARYLRLTVTGCAGSYTGTWTSIAELRAFGSVATGVDKAAMLSPRRILTEGMTLSTAMSARVVIVPPEVTAVGFFDMRGRRVHRWVRGGAAGAVRLSIPANLSQCSSLLTCAWEQQ